MSSSTLITSISFLVLKEHSNERRFRKEISMRNSAFNGREKCAEKVRQYSTGEGKHRAGMDYLDGRCRFIWCLLTVLFLVGFSNSSSADQTLVLYGIPASETWMPGTGVGPITTAEQFCYLYDPHDDEYEHYQWIGPNFELDIHGNYSLNTYCEWSWVGFSGEFDDAGHPILVPQPNIKLALYQLEVVCQNPIGPNPNWPYSYGYSWEYAPISPNFCGHYFLDVSLPAAPQQGSCCNAGTPQSFVGDPINVASGNVLLQNSDFVADKNNAAFKRFYNSVDTSEAGTAGWRHSFTRSIKPKNSSVETRAYVASSATSSPYADPATACTSGFLEVQAQVPAWSGASVTYSGGNCQLNKNGVSIGFIMIYSPFEVAAQSQTPVAHDVYRDDGQQIRFIVDGNAIVAPPGINLKLQQTSSGFLLVDASDTVEYYDSNGKLQSITSRNGVVQTPSYDSSGRLSSMTDNFGHSLSLSYDSDNHLLSVTRQ